MTDDRKPTEWEDVDAQRVERLLRTLDHELPHVEVSEVVRRARRTRTAPYRRLALAASALGLLAAGAAAAIPGTPLNDWLRDALRLPSAPESAPTPAPGGAGGLAGPGVRFIPSGPVTITFVRADAEATLDVRFSDDDRLSLAALTGIPDFSLGPGGVRVENGPATGDFALRVPRAIADLHVLVEEVPLLTLDSGVLVVPSGADRTALETGLRLPLGRTPPP